MVAKSLLAEYLMAILALDPWVHGMTLTLVVDQALLI